jgi:pyruvate dehydrogenase E2 component (dihydrolipoamide acetyltransferase)
MIEIRMPQIASDMTEADLLTWLVAPGDAVAAGDVIAEIETDKSTVELEAPESGTLAEIIVPAGTLAVKVGELLGRLESLVAADPAVAAAPAPEPAPPGSARPPSAPTQPMPPSEPVSPATDGSAPSTALARRLADRAGIAIDSLRGSGAHGRVTKRDVEQQAEGAVPAPAGQTPAASETASGDQRIPLSRMRRTIAERLGESKRTIPHFYLRSEIEISELLALRARLNAEGSGLRVSVNDFVIRASALALREVPEANASWDGDALLLHGAVDVSVAVATDGGLITPIVRAADRKGLAAISEEMRDLAGRAREGQLSPREYQGGGFSVSNLGMYGIDSVLPIVNPPQSCILGVGAGKQKPVVRDGELAVGHVMALTLSADHRVVDGAVGARLLGAIQRRLEDPLEMLL